MEAIDWVRDSADALRVASSVVVTNPSSVIIYGDPGSLALLRMRLEARTVTVGSRVRSWVADADGVQVSLCEVGHVAQEVSL